MGRDAYPLTSLMTLWDYTGDQLYLDFARQTAIRLLATQHDDGGFSTQAAVGVLTGVSCVPEKNSISFGSGLLAPIELLEWATRDRRWPADFQPRLRRWADLVLRLQTAEGVWTQANGTPYPLIGAGMLFSLIKAGQLLQDRRCVDAVQRYLTAMNARQDFVAGTHAFLSALYAHVADRALKP